MKRTTILRLALLIVLATSVHGTVTTETLGASAAQELKKNLMGALSKALQDGDIAGGIRICSTQAMPLTAKSGEVDPAILSIHRRTDRPRNPANQADRLDEVALRYFAADKERTFVTLSESETVTRYYQPLRIQPMCLTCHGDPLDFPKEVTASLRANYAQDRATGYKAGDLRGIIQVRVQAEASQ